LSNWRRSIWIEFLRRKIMEILVCVKRVPDTAENEIDIKSDGTGIEEEDLVYSVNEWDNYAVEEAIQIRDKVGGSVTVVTVGDDESEEVLRREMAMGADKGILLADDAFEDSDGRGIATILKAAIEKGQYDLVLTGAQADDGAGQVGGMLAAMLDWPYASLVNLIDTGDGGNATLVRQEYAGMAHTHVTCDLSSGAVLTLRPGSFQAEEGGAAAGQVEDKSGEVGDLSAKRKFLEVVEAEVGDVDITKSDVLVSVGRGIEDEENIELAEELAEAMGAVVSCSRPIVDAKWLEKSRQVGTSGQTVKPKVYMAMGISGSFQHLGGIKGSPFIVAVNKNPKAPIFQVADVGIVEDILEFMPELSEKIEEG
jgi:electron transfer flavoprotein alpha subunit